MVVPVSLNGNQQVRPRNFRRKYNPLEERYWVIEAQETHPRNPHFLMGVSKGRCFILWDDNIKKAKKFESELQAFKWARDNRLLCGFRIVMRINLKTRQEI